MSVQWITFRIEASVVGGRSYDTRYQALVDAVNAHATDAWDEPTSFWIFESTSSRAAIAASIKAAIATSKDVVLLASMEHTGATVIGSSSKLAALKRLVPALVVA